MKEWISRGCPTRKYWVEKAVFLPRKFLPPLLKQQMGLVWVQPFQEKGWATSAMRIFIISGFLFLSRKNVSTQHSPPFLSATVTSGVGPTGKMTALGWRGLGSGHRVCLSVRQPPSDDYRSTHSRPKCYMSFTQLDFTTVWGWYHFICNLQIRKWRHKGCVSAQGHKSCEFLVFHPVRQRMQSCSDAHFHRSWEWYVLCDRLAFPQNKEPISRLKILILNKKIYSEYS